MQVVGGGRGGGVVSTCPFLMQPIHQQHPWSRLITEIQS